MAAKKLPTITGGRPAAACGAHQVDARALLSLPRPSCRRVWGPQSMNATRESVSATAETFWLWKEELVSASPASLARKALLHLDRCLLCDYGRCEQAV